MKNTSAATSSKWRGLIYTSTSELRATPNMSSFPFPFFRLYRGTPFHNFRLGKSSAADPLSPIQSFMLYGAHLSAAKLFFSFFLSLPLLPPPPICQEHLPHHQPRRWAGLPLVEGSTDMFSFEFGSSSEHNYTTSWCLHFKCYSIKKFHYGNRTRTPCNGKLVVNYHVLHKCVDLLGNIPIRAQRL